MGLLRGYAYLDKGSKESAQCQIKSFIPLKKILNVRQNELKMIFSFKIEQHCYSMIQY